MDVLAVHLGERQALMEDGTLIEITDLLDEEGEFTDDPEAAVAAVAKLDGGWLAIDLRGFVNRQAH